MAIATTTCTYSLPYRAGQAGGTPSGAIEVSPLNISNATSSFTPWAFQWGKEVCVTESEASAGGSTDIEPLVYSLTFGFGTIIFLMVFIMAYKFIKSK